MPCILYTISVIEFHDDPWTAAAPRRWLRGLSVRPPDGIWYDVHPRGSGEVLIGERDLRRA